jgi:phosphoribosylanthranilate isomerase
MMTTTDVKLKVCGLREAANLRDVAALGADFVGFIFYPPSPRYVSPAHVASLPDAGPQRVGVFVNATVAETLETAKQARLALLQLHGDETPETCAALRAKYRIIKAFAVDEEFSGAALAAYETACDYFLFDTKTDARGGSGRNFEWQVLRRFRIRRPFFLSGGVGPENAAEAVAACAGLPLFAIDVNSRVETAPGVKSVTAVRQVINTLRLRALA